MKTDCITSLTAPEEVNIPLTGDQKYFLSNLQSKLILKQNQIMALQRELPELAKAVSDGVQKVARDCRIQPGYDFDQDLNIVELRT